MKESGAKNRLQLRLVILGMFSLVCVLSIRGENGNISRIVSGESNLTAVTVQDPQLDYSRFLHTSQRHASQACTSCHERSADNSATPKFPGHKACTNCHTGQFVTPAVPMCLICHTNVQSSDPPRKSFPARFNENFNVKFDHAQHMAGAARPRNGCNGCHDKPLLRGAALSIPVGLNAHNGCYTCHTPSSKSNAGREMASCGVCHDQKSFARTSTNSRAFRFAFSHAKHGPRQRLACADCHSLTAGAPQSRQVSSPTPAEHFPLGRTNCVTCHNGKRAFGGDLGFKDCQRCHTGPTFRIGG
ncbi:MAG: cytochrome c3 family protein [Pyrinomonadaceae bacterium]|nr:cytochrome c3 family protein [Pyrinomonadaceae bacterium]